MCYQWKEEKKKEKQTKEEDDEDLKQHLQIKFNVLNSYTYIHIINR